MSVDMREVLSTELTAIPQVLSGYFGKFYSNALCNGCTWLFGVWFVLHIGLDYTVNVVLSKMKYKEYNRIRLKNTLWYLGFYCAAFLHTGENFFHNRMDIMGSKRTNLTIYNDVGSDLVTSFMMLFTFFLHSAFWEALEYESKTAFLSYVLLCCVLFMSFILRSLEVAFTLTAYISVCQICVQSSKLLYVVVKQDNSYLRIFIALFFGLGICSFFFSYLVGVPLVFLIPFFRKLVAAHLPSGFIPLLLVLGGWYVSEIGNSPLFKLLGHWLFHTDKTNECCGNVVECSLFPPRNDVAFNLMQMRKEIKEREERRHAMRTASKKGMLVQTIKCMVSLKRKIHAKRAAALQEDEEIGDMELKTAENDENARLLEETKDEDKIGDVQEICDNVLIMEDDPVTNDADPVDLIDICEEEIN